MYPAATSPITSINLLLLFEFLQLAGQSYRRKKCSFSGLQRSRIATAVPDDSLLELTPTGRTEFPGRTMRREGKETRKASRESEKTEGKKNKRR
jgi:hypothetical protein